ncbi:MAG: NAD(P)/FAD-dependent oxidoreductase [Pirellulales bacterium]
MISFDHQNLDRVSRGDWDVLVIGAGPAGAMAARGCAAQGLQTLLVDAKHFPRQKVCGGCLNGRSLGVLRAAGLQHLIDSLSGFPTHKFRLRTDGHQIDIDLPEGLTVDRAAFDHGLATAAVHAGATFLPGVVAKLVEDHVGEEEPHRLVRLEAGSRHQELKARMVVVADGLAGRAAHAFRAQRSLVAEHSYIGLGTQMPADPRDGGEFEPGTIYMAVGQHGYVGVVRLGNGHLNVAAALSPTIIRGGNSPGQVLVNTLQDAGFEAPVALRDVNLRGTPFLTRKTPRLAGRRMFVAGDAAGYVEPFTGEGMAWALVAGDLLAPLVEQSMAAWDPSAAETWERIYRTEIQRHQWICRGLAALLRRPWLVQGAAEILRWFPGLGSRIAASLSSPADMPGEGSR